jgi:outer membrane murein-binding lipoprotein Lpp
MRHAAALLVLGSLALAGCSQQAAAPADPGVCWHVVFDKEGAPKFNKLASGVKNLETCAATLEGMRIRFARMGGAEEVIGAYQGQYLFIERIGVRTSTSLTGGRYVALVRTGDGRLAIPGAMPQQR